MHYPRYCLTHHAGISSNITNPTHFRTPPMLPTLAHHTLYPCWRNTHAGTSPWHPANVTHASMSPTLAHHPRQQATKANTPPTLAHLSRMHATHDTHASTNSTPFLKLLGVLGIWKTVIEKLNFFRGNQSALLKRRLFFQKQKHNFFRKKLLLILVSFWPFYIF